jgi:hypothetical protein
MGRMVAGECRQGPINRLAGQPLGRQTGPVFHRSERDGADRRLATWRRLGRSLVVELGAIGFVFALALCFAAQPANGSEISMPTSGTHITIVQRIALDAQFQPLLGNPDPTLPETDPEAVKMRFACLGSVGPDILYALGDYGGKQQDFENFLVKVAATFDSLGELMGKIGRYIDGVENSITLGVVDSINQSTALVTGATNQGALALLASQVNLWPVFEPSRQRDQPRQKWYWADYLHYVRSGRFVRELIDRSAGNPNLRAYAFGYLTHYVTDVVGHPYVNQVVGAPWRLAWQRHHLVENFIDAYVWDRWHTPLPPPAPPTSEEQPLDRVQNAPNPIGGGAPYTFARINDWINIGKSGGIDPVDAIVDQISQEIEKGLFDIGVVDDIEPVAPTDADFKAWCTLFVRALHATYTEDPIRRPMNLASGILPGGVKRSDGFPTEEDVASAYGVFRLVMKVGTEEKIQPPQPPNIVADVTAAVQQVLNKVAADLAGIPAPPPLPNGGAFSPAAILDALIAAAEWAGAVAEAVAKAVGDFLQGVVTVAAVPVSDSIKYVLYLLNSALFALYRTLRDVLVLQAYSPPYTDQLTQMFGTLSASTLWRSAGNGVQGAYPHEELPVQREYLHSSFNPAVFPSAKAENPAVAFVAPYGPSPGSRPIPASPDAFIESPLGAVDMFDPAAPRQASLVGDVQSFADGTLNFGGAIENSKRGIGLAVAGFPGGKTLPDYNLDGDRGYGWPCWDVTPAPIAGQAAGDPLAPDAPPNQPAMIATVHAEVVTG